MTARGKIIFTLLIIGVVGLGVWKWLPKLKTASSTPASSSGASPTARSSTPGDQASPAVAAAELTETQTEIPKLATSGIYQPKDNVVEIELSEYAGYAGLIMANGGLAPNENSIFAKKYGFKVSIKLSEEESWSALNSGKMAASATTVDVLAIYGRQFQVSVPIQIG